jgi:aldose sugar dehydrogenase
MHRSVTIVIGAAAVALLTSIAIAQTPAAQAPELLGQQVYERSCAACHNGGDETAPALERLRTLGRDRVSTAIHPGGVMATQAAGLSEDQRTQVTAFITASPERLAQLAAQSRAAPAAVPPEIAAKFPYPVRRIRDDRDSPKVPAAPAWPAPKLGAGPFESESWEQRKLRTVVVARGINTPRALEFLPTGELLIAERAGKLRILRDGKLDPDAIRGTPEVAVLGTATGFMDIALHPDFAKNGWIYLAYHKPAFGMLGVNAIFRGRWNGREIVEGKEIFLGDDVDALYTKLTFGPDGKLYATIGCPGVGTDVSIGRAQHPDDYAGKTLRLNDDGTIPKDNPFIGRKGYNPAVFTLGHRVNLGLAVNPRTGDLWVSEHGPNGGDEVNILRAGQNYGWPVSSEGRYYNGVKVPAAATKAKLTRPHIAFVPSIAPGDVLFYTGDKFPAWKGNLFIGAMRFSEAPRTGHLLRIVLNENGDQVRSEMLLTDLHQRIRNVAQGPDGSIWLATDEGADSVLLRLEPGG